MGEGVDPDGPSALLTELAGATPYQRVELLRQVVKVELAQVLKKSVEELDDDVGFFDLGMDSLMAIELRNGLSTKVGQKLSATIVMDYPDVAALTTYVIDEILGLSNAKSDNEEPQQLSEENETELEVDALSSGEV